MLDDVARSIGVLAMWAHAWRVIHRNWLVLLCGAAVGLAVGGMLLLSQPTSYVATATISATTQARVPTYVQLAMTDDVLEQAAKATDTDEAVLLDSVTVSQATGSSLITVAAKSNDQGEAVTLANAYSETLVAAIQKLERLSSGDNSASYVALASPANVANPSINSKLRLIIFGIPPLIGLAIAGIFAYRRTSRGLVLRRPEDLVEIFDTRVLFDLTSGHALSAEARNLDLLAEEIRSLLADDVRVLGLISASGGSDDLVPVKNLALVLSSSCRVAVVDANLPVVGKEARLLEDEPRPIGLTEVLLGSATLDEVIQEKDGISVLLAGKAVLAPELLLKSQAFSDTLADLADKFSLVVVNLPAEAGWNISRAVVLPLVEWKKTKDKELADLLAGLEDSGRPVPGVASYKRS